MIFFPHSCVLLISYKLRDSKIHTSTRTGVSGPVLCPNPQLEQALRFDTADGDCDAAEPRSLAQQTLDLRRRLEEEQAAYKRKLTAYQEGQQRQAQLVQKLQAKVRLFYSPLYPRQRLTLSSLVGTAGASVQEAVWGFRADPAGEDLRVGQTPAECESNLFSPWGGASLRGLELSQIPLRVSAMPPTVAIKMSKAATWRTL